ncbi:MAG: hypothetical protein EBR82_49095 [Caulobacteraceae bacterium]|nr:hypothetical protein [Caulobacteraceae bacterium]
MNDTDKHEIMQMEYLNDNCSKVQEFMKTFGQTIPPQKILPFQSIIDLRCDLINEEVTEMYEAESLVEYFDAVLDQLYVAYGHAVAAGISPAEVARGFAEVHRSNMSKLWTDAEVNERPVMSKAVRVAESGRCFIVTNQSGKVLKSPSYSPADLTFIEK